MITAAPAVQQKSRVTATLPYAVGCAALAVLAFSFNWLTGHRGIFIFDQSIVFDGGWRVLDGQIPYRDVLFPFGPVTFWIQALFFRVFGVNWSAVVLSACVLNVVSTLAAIRLVRMLTGGSRLLALCAGLMTAVCMQPPFGTLWLEQTALFFDLMSLLLIVESLAAAEGRRILWEFAAGASLVLAMLSKQNYGIFFTPVAVLTLTAVHYPEWRRVARSLFWFLSGVAAAIGGFVLWLTSVSNFHRFVQRFFVVGGQVGRSRLTVGIIEHALRLGFPGYRYEFEFVAILGGALAFVFFFRNMRQQSSPAQLPRELLPAIAVSILLPFFRSFAQATTKNEWENSYGLAAVAFCVGLGLIWRSVPGLPFLSGSRPLLNPAAVRWAVSALSFLWAGIIVMHIGSCAWTRCVQEYLPSTWFSETLQFPGLRGLVWGEPRPEYFGPGKEDFVDLHASDFDHLLAYLSVHQSHFFVMGDAEILYGLLHVPSPQPLLYFDEGQSFLPAEIPALDSEILASLRRNHVGTVVREKVTFEDVTKNSMAGFVQTQSWVARNFIHSTDFGKYEIWTQSAEAARVNQGSGVN